MAVFVTGDIHRNPVRLSKDSFYEQKNFSGNKDENIKYDVSSFEELIANARNKAIDDFLKEICKMIVQSENNGNYRFFAVEIKQAIADLAEQLKAGGENENYNKEES